MEKMNKFLIIITSVLMLFLTIGCQNDFDNNDINDNDNNLNRLTVVNQNIPLVNGFGLKDNSSNNPEYVFTLIANVDAPTVNDNQLQSTHVEVVGDFAYVSYNMKGSEVIGSVDVIDINDPSNPNLINTIEFEDKDINTINFYNNKILVGGESNNGAFIKMINPLDLDDNFYLDISAFSTNSMYLLDDKLYATAGDNGGLYCWEITPDGFQEILNVELSDARSVKALDENNVYVLSGNDIHLWNGTNINNLNIIQPEWIQTDSKSDIDVDENYLFASLNRGGVKVIDVNTNQVIQTFEKPITPDGSNSEDYVSNSVSFNSPLLFIADGGAGIRICGETENLKNSLPFSELGYFDFGGPLSSNFVTSVDNYIFVATGLGGLKILTFEDSGLPDDFEPGVVCETLKDDIISMFPEQENAMDTHPELFNDENELRVITDSETEVWVQFVWEGAGWKNTFGYYTYELGNEPTSVSDLNKNVIFPNVSGTNEGGGLNSGDMVNLGTFPENTVIGFYIVAKGWSNGEMVNGSYTHYTDLNLNPNNTQQHLLFTENCCNELVLTFEDVKLPGGDKDFNDIILTIKDNNNGFENLPESFKTENVFFVPLCDESFNPDCIDPSIFPYEVNDINTNDIKLTFMYKLENEDDETVGYIFRARNGTSEIINNVEVKIANNSPVWTSPEIPNNTEVFFMIPNPGAGFKLHWDGGQTNGTSSTNENQIELSCF